MSSLLGRLYASHFVACLLMALLVIGFQFLLYVSQTFLSTQIHDMLALVLAFIGP